MEQPAQDDLIFFVNSWALAEHVRGVYNKHPLSKLLKLRFCTYKLCSTVNHEDIEDARVKDATNYLLLTKGRQYWKLILNDALYFQNTLSPGHMWHEHKMLTVPGNSIRVNDYAAYTYRWQIVHSDIEPQFASGHEELKLGSIDFEWSHDFEKDVYEQLFEVDADPGEVVGCTLEKVLNDAYVFFSGCPSVSMSV